ncbi:MAG: hypothetical protein JW820_11005 [Spirochaetales bacterium]|nr:hypothetical protein [Spirochaetales bacterium]
MRRSLLLALLVMALPTAVSAQPEYLAARLWCELEPLIRTEEEYPLPREEARRRVLEEARGVFSAMIYGFAFSYTPGDSTRQIADELVLTPIGEIPWGDPHLRIADAWLEGGRLFAKVEYDLQGFQEDRRRAWGSTAIPTAAGTGAASMFLSSPAEGKRNSLEAAFREALRDHLRPIRFNKPREIQGELVLWRAPETIIRAGTYQTRVDVKLRVREIRDYSLF